LVNTYLAAAKEIDNGLVSLETAKFLRHHIKAFCLRHGAGLSYVDRYFAVPQRLVSSSALFLIANPNIFSTCVIIILVILTLNLPYFSMHCSHCPKRQHCGLFALQSVVSVSICLFVPVTLHAFSHPPLSPSSADSLLQPESLPDLQLYYPKSRLN
jgi:hypothetical protein